MNHETDTPRTNAIQFQPRPISMTIENEMLLALSRKLERELAEAKAEVERLREAMKSCWWATNTYDGNYARACDNVAIIVTNALKIKDNK